MSSRSHRRTREETSRLVREAAVILLERDGLRGFANSVRLDDALTLLLAEDNIRLTHGSIYGRIWADQRDFQLDVVATAVSRYRGDDIAEAITATADSSPGGLPSDSIGSLFASAVAAAMRSRRWNLWIGASAAVVSTPGPEDDERLAGALTQARTEVTSSIVAALAAALDLAPATIPAELFVNLVIGAAITGEIAGPVGLLAASVAESQAHPSTRTVIEPGLT
ncbi:MAG: hypothetical protein GY724_15380 [Actinomycetia bacterium]|nr:hypothetical protein [Actinomycetes bacterium]MCP5034919.1 hypothetical protein [Actinomycetes bacterium]